MESINQRIASIIDEFKLNKNSFSKAIGHKSNVIIQNIVTGRKSKPSFEVLEQILLSFDSISAEWLMRGEGNMLKSTVDSPKKEETPSSSNEELAEYGINWRDKYHELIGEVKVLRKLQGIDKEEDKPNGTSG